MINLDDTQPATKTEKIIEWIAQISSIIYFLTPLFQIILLYQKKLRIEKIPMLLLFSILLNCLLWIGLGVGGDELWWSMIICNGIGLGVNLILVILHLYKFFENRFGSFIGYSLYICIVIALLFVVIHFIAKTVDTVGFCAMIINVFMYTSPASNLIKLFKTSEYDFLPILTNIIGFFACTIWIIYGIILSDSNNSKTKIIISNGISLFMVSCQICIWIYFFYKKKIKKIIEIENPSTVCSINEGLIKNDEENKEEKQDNNSKQNVLNDNENNVNVNK